MAASLHGGHRAPVTKPGITTTRIDAELSNFDIVGTEQLLASATATKQKLRAKLKEEVRRRGSLSVPWVFIFKIDRLGARPLFTAFF